MYRDNEAHSCSLAKGAIWRFAVTADTLIISLFVTGKVVIELAKDRLFPPAWSVKETPACFIVRGGQAHVYFEEEPWPALRGFSEYTPVPLISRWFRHASLVRV